MISENGRVKELLDKACRRLVRWAAKKWPDLKVEGHHHEWNYGETLGIVLRLHREGLPSFKRAVEFSADLLRCPDKKARRRLNHFLAGMRAWIEDHREVEEWLKNKL